MQQYFTTFLSSREDELHLYQKMQFFITVRCLDAAQLLHPSGFAQTTAHASYQTLKLKVPLVCINWRCPSALTVNWVYFERLASSNAWAEYEKLKYSWTFSIPEMWERISGFSVGQSQLVRQDTLQFLSSIIVHFKCVFCDRLCLDSLLFFHTTLFHFYLLFSNSNSGSPGNKFFQV